VTRFDLPSSTFWLVDGSDPNMQQYVGMPVGLGTVLPYTRTGVTVTLGPVSLGSLNVGIQYRILPIVIDSPGVGTVNTPPEIPPVVLSLPRGARRLSRWR
jgi:hypothetical protein